MKPKILTTFAVFTLIIGQATAQTTAAPAATNAQFTVQGIAAPTEPIPPEMQSAGISNYSFIVYGDTRGRRDGKEVQYEHSLVIDSILATIRKLKNTGFPVRFVLQSGDAVVNGAHPKQWNISFVGLINRITKDGGVPYFLAPGNHDVTAAKSITAVGRAGGLSNYLAAVANLIPRDGTPRRLEGYPTYAFGYGNAFVIAMDSNIAADQTQLRWVTEQMEGLDRSRYHHVFAFFHHPPFSSGTHGGAILEAPALELRKTYMPLFRKHHVDALLTGHEHLFEHWVERYQFPGGPTNRMDIVVTGGGGAPLMGYRGEPDLRDYLKTNGVVKIQLEHLVKPGPQPGDNPYHFVVVTVNGDSLRMEVTGVDWGSNFQPYRSRAVDFR